METRRRFRIYAIVIVQLSHNVYAAGDSSDQMDGL